MNYTNASRWICFGLGQFPARRRQIPGGRGKAAARRNLVALAVRTRLEADLLLDTDMALTVPASLALNVFIAQRRERWEQGLGHWAW